MPRANRYYLPGHVWHLTHRCHGHSFLLSSVRDRRRWLSWLFEARKRYGLAVLNYVVTSNHVHLLVHAGEDRLTIPRSMQLLAGRVAQEFNLRTERGGAFWEDRYHATAVESGSHLRRCMTYIDMNMVRAGAVRHPDEWEGCGYREIQRAPKRYARIDRVLLARLLDLPDVESLAEWQRQAVAQALPTDVARKRSAEWTQSIAVGSEAYVASVQMELGIVARFRTIEDESDDAFVLRETTEPYQSDCRLESERLSPENTHSWKLSNWVATG